MVGMKGILATISKMGEVENRTKVKTSAKRSGSTPDVTTNLKVKADGNTLIVGSALRGFRESPREERLQQ